MYKAESAKLPVKKNQQITAVYIIHIVIQLRKAPAEMQAPFFGCLFLAEKGGTARILRKFRADLTFAGG